MPTTFSNTKIMALLLCLLVWGQVANALLALPMPDGTNATEPDRLAFIEANRQREFYFYLGRLDGLQREVERVELALTILSIFTGSTLAAMALLSTRDRIRRAKTTKPAPAK